MPLVIISGQPCSGKTTFATGLARYLEALPAASGTAGGAASGSAGEVGRVVVVNDEALGVKKGEGYSSTYERSSYGRPSLWFGHAMRASISRHQCHRCSEPGGASPPAALDGPFHRFPPSMRWQHVTILDPSNRLRHAPLVPRAMSACLPRLQLRPLKRCLAPRSRLPPTVH
jgi:hypothetical protein